MGHRGRRDRDRAPGWTEHRRCPGGGKALDLARGRRLRDADPARDRRHRSRLQSLESWSTTCIGASLRPGANLAIAIPVAMLAYTGVETVSNLAEEARDPVRNVPAAYKLVAGRGVRDLLHAPARRALGVAGRGDRDGSSTTLLALPPEEGGYANDPILGVVENLGSRGGLTAGRRSRSTSACSRRRSSSSPRTPE